MKIITIQKRVVNRKGGRLRNNNKLMAIAISTLITTTMIIKLTKITTL
jgi:hypothetical protein